MGHFQLSEEKKKRQMHTNFQQGQGDGNGHAWNWLKNYSSDEKVWGVGKGDSPLKLLHVYRVYDTKGYGKVCDLESADCMLSLFLSLSISTPSVTRVVIFVSHVFRLTKQEKKRDCL